MIRLLTILCLGALVVHGWAVTPRALSNVTPGTKPMLVLPPPLSGGFTLTLSTNLPVKIFSVNRLGEKWTFFLGATNYTMQIPNEGGNKFFTTGAEVPLVWDAPANYAAAVTGYNIYYGAAANAYTIRRIPVGLTNSTLMQVVGCPAELHITVTASLADGSESEFAWPEIVVAVPSVVSLRKN